MADAATTLDDAPVGLQTIAQRLRAAADRVEELEEQLAMARERRDELIVAAYDDEALPYGTIGKHTRLSRARIIAIVAAS